jgi:endonuclease/exonuclease/phosphatase (EEP) superfamily protein YafD
MIMRGCRVLRAIFAILTLGLAGLAIATAAGLLGPWSIVADAFSHFRFHIALLALLLTAAALHIDWRLAAVGAFIAAANVALALTYAQAPRAVSAGGTAFKVMTINVLYRADNDARIIAQIEAENPDLVFFQELTKDRLDLLGSLKGRYPWQITCAGAWRCDVAIVSRHRWETAQAQPVGAAQTKMAWARFGPEWGNALVATVHLKWPLVSNQMAQLQAVARITAGHAGPVIVAGDFNAAPWSAAVKTFTKQSRLHAAGGFVPTWPQRTFVNGASCLLCFPQLQIDHVFVNSQVQVFAFRTGADIGSDHLPLIAELELPRTIAAASHSP